MKLTWSDYELVFLLLKEKRKKEETLGSSISHGKAAAGRIPWFDLGVKAFIHMKGCEWDSLNSCYFPIIVHLVLVQYLSYECTCYQKLTGQILVQINKCHKFVQWKYTGRICGSCVKSKNISNALNIFIDFTGQVCKGHESLGWSL